jgi:predicted metal-dependent peptidase
MADGHAVHEHRGTRAIQKMVELAPSTGGLALWIHHQDLDDENDESLAAANDGATIFYGPCFERLSLPEQIGLVAHQVLHVALRHPQRQIELGRLIGDVDPILYNICADAIVNSSLGHLGWLELPAKSVNLEDLLRTVLNIQQTAEAALLEWDLERLYRVVDDRRPGPADRRANRRWSRRRSQAGGEGEPSAGSRAEQEADGDTGLRVDGPRAARTRMLGTNSPRDLLPSPDDSEPEHQAEQAREWRERITRAHAGDGEHSMLRALLADLPKVRTPWEQILRTRLCRGLSQRPGLSWSRPSRSYLANAGRTADGRRMPWEPGRAYATAIARLVVMVDVSGSIENPLLERFAREIEAISRRMEAAVAVIIGDDRVRDQQTFGPGHSNLRSVQFQGGGGTDFTPLLRAAEAHRPDIGVFLTDLDGPAHHRPRWPVIWAVPPGCRGAREPFGTKLVLE